MPTLSYEVIGEHSAPDDFKAYVSRTFGQTKQLHIIAQQTTNDELAARRGNTNTQIEFDLSVSETYHGDDLVICGFMYVDGVRGNWIVIEVKDRVRFDILN